MAWPWLATAVKSIPWASLVARAPTLIDAASSLMYSRKVSEVRDNAVKTETRLEELRGAVARLALQDQESARVIREITEQTRDLTMSLEILAAKVRLLSVVLAATLVVAVVTLALVLPGR
ncbi:MAG: hypothetical protein R3286_11500 [Gammaproteobacteria bacterium]|nr:hypothetical protein [Gammaproteobacteria bacterium]